MGTRALSERPAVSEREEPLPTESVLIQVGFGSRLFLYLLI